MSNMPILPPLTPRSSPGCVPTAHVTQFYLGEDLTKLAGFISGAPPDLLYNIMSAATEVDLRALLANTSPLDSRMQPSIPMTSTCARITRWLEAWDSRGAISKDVVPCALFLLLKVRVLNRGRSTLRTYDETIRLCVAVKIAYGNICDGTIWPKTWEHITSMPFDHTQRVELAFLKDLDWTTWVHENDFMEFIGRFEVVWKVLLESNDLL